MRPRLLGDRRGASLVEYLLLLGLAAIVVLAGARELGASIGGKATSQAACIRTLQCSDGHGSGIGVGRPRLTANPAFNEVTAAAGATYRPATGRATIRGAGDGHAVHPSDISQGQLGDCFLVGTLAAIAHGNPQVIADNIRQNPDGSYTVTFYERGWLGATAVPVRVTADFPATDQRWVFAQPGDSDGGQSELWPMLYEKAYAQWRGGYNVIGQGGHPTDVMTAVTGNRSRYHRVRGRLWDMSFSDFASHFADNIVVAGTHGAEGARNQPVFQDGTLVASHAYWVESVDTENLTVTLRNPWGWSRAPITLDWERFKQGIHSISVTRR
jgi:Flp pilus assembly pilin Flp